MKDIPGALRKYTGRNPLIEDGLKRLGYEMSLASSEAFYKKGTYDWQQKNSQIVLNKETADFIYKRFTPLGIVCTPNSRPFLKRTVDRLCAGKRTGREKVLSILDYVYRGRYAENADLFPGKNIYILNALEEEIPKVAHVSCECNSRLIICLAQIAGFPARYVASYAYLDPDKGCALNGGHAMVEIFLEGAWALFDSDHGFCCVKKNGKFANLWDLERDLSLVENQPGWVYRAFGGNRKRHLSFRKTFLSPYSVKSFSNYSVNDYLQYDWRWIFCSDSSGNKIAAQILKKREALKRRAMKILLQAKV